MRILAVALALASTAVLAQQGPPRGPPPEALQACSGLSEGAACAFTHRDRNLTGTCRTGPEGGALACAPAGMGPGGHHGPPPEALAACASLASGAACTVSFNGQTQAGTCVAGPSGEPLACLPPRP